MVFSKWTLFLFQWLTIFLKISDPPPPQGDQTDPTILRKGSGVSSGIYRLTAPAVFVYKVNSKMEGKMDKYTGLGILQTLSASLAGGLLGDTIPHAIGIFVLYTAWLRLYMENENENRKLSEQAEHATAESHELSQHEFRRNTKSS